MLSSWSALMSKSLQVASSDPVAKAFPFGKNCEKEVRLTQRLVEQVAHRDSVDVRLMAGEGLLADGVANIPKLKKNYDFFG